MEIVAIHRGARITKLGKMVEDFQKCTEAVLLPTSSPKGTFGTLSSSHELAVDYCNSDTKMLYTENFVTFLHVGQDETQRGPRMDERTRNPCGRRQL